MTPPPKVSLVVLNHDAVKKLGPEAAVYLKSIASTRYPNLEIIIVDNASTDESVKMVQNLFRDDPRVRLVKLRENHGYAGGNNAGFKRCSGDVKYVAFLNNDLTVEEEWLEKIVVVMESDEDIAASQPKIMQMNNKHLIDSLGGFIDTIGRAYDLGHGLPHRIKVEKPYRIFYARGAALVVRKKVFEELSGFDEDYFIYYEETDLCWRMRLMGYDVVAVPTSVVYHLGGGTVGRPNPRNIYLYRKNQLNMLLKNYSAINLIINTSELILRYILYSAATIVRTRDLRIPAALTAAIVWNLKNLRKTLLKRRHIQARRKIKDHEIGKHMLSKRRYDELTSYLPKAY